MNMLKMYLIFVTHSDIIQRCDLVITNSTTNWILFKWTKQVGKMNSKNEKWKQTKTKKWTTKANNKIKWPMWTNEQLKQTSKVKNQNE
jgi:hypothetical protein